MRLRQGSQTIWILDVLWQFGQLPYSSLALLGGDFEWTKDCAQRLIRKKYIAVIKDTNLKSLYLTPLGRREYIRFCERAGIVMDVQDKPPVVYNADKARRTDKVNEVSFLVKQAGLTPNYLSCREAKEMLEEDAPRSSDSIKYSRFAGILFTESGGLLLYNFGRHNISPNIAGEKNAKAAAVKLYHRLGGKQFMPRFSMLVLGASADTALEILAYSDMLADKEKQSMKLAKRHFNCRDYGKVFDDILFLPITAETPDMLPILVAPGTGLYKADNIARKGVIW